MNSAIATISALAEVGDVAAALRAEHNAIDMLLRALEDDLFSGTSHTFMPLLDRLIDFCATHFTREESIVFEYGLPQERNDAHAAAHQSLLGSLRAVRTVALTDGLSPATVEVVDVLHNLYEHVHTYDKAAYEGRESLFRSARRLAE